MFGVVAVRQELFLIDGRKGSHGIANGGVCGSENTVRDIFYEPTDVDVGLNNDSQLNSHIAIFLRCATEY